MHYLIEIRCTVYLQILPILETLFYVFLLNVTKMIGLLLIFTIPNLNNHLINSLLILLDDWLTITKTCELCHNILFRPLLGIYFALVPILRVSYYLIVCVLHWNCLCLLIINYFIIHLIKYC